MLSPRIIHFSEQEVLWQCASNAATENFPSGLPTAISYSIGEESRLRSLVAKLKTKQIEIKDRAALNSIWKMAAENYSRLNLTKFTDKVVALAGLAKVISQVSHEKYHAGLWDFDFVEQLSWRIDGCRNASGAPSWRYPNDGHYVAPSWSWLSMNGAVIVRDRAIQDREYELTILGSGRPEIELARTGIEFGPISNAYFEARAMLYSITFILDDHEEYSWKADLGNVACNMRLFPDERLVNAASSPDVGSATIKSNAIMLAYTNAFDDSSSSRQGYMLAVAPRGGSGQFIRRGLIEFSNLQTDAWRKLEECRVRTAEAEAGLHDIILR